MRMIVIDLLRSQNNLWWARQNQESPHKILSHNWNELQPHYSFSDLWQRRREENREMPFPSSFSLFQAPKLFPQLPSQKPELLRVHFWQRNRILVWPRWWRIISLCRYFSQPPPHPALASQHFCEREKNVNIRTWGNVCYKISSRSSPRAPLSCFM